jgi:hypothetical protein
MMMMHGGEKPIEWMVRLRAALARWGLASPASLPLNRRDTLRVGFDLADVPEKDRESALALKLLRYLGEQPAGYAWKSQGARVDVWYWRKAAPAGYRHVPEQLLRQELPTGLSLITCTVGYELCEVKSGQLIASRWFDELPTEAQIQDFASDPGKNDARLVKPVRVSTSRSLLKGWKLGGKDLKALPGAQINPKLSVLPALGVCTACAVISFFALDHFTTLERVKVIKAQAAELKKSASAAVAVGAELDAIQAQLAPLRQVEPRVGVSLRKTSHGSCAGA